MAREVVVDGAIEVDGAGSGEAKHFRGDEAVGEVTDREHRVWLQRPVFPVLAGCAHPVSVRGHDRGRDAVRCMGAKLVSAAEIAERPPA